MTRTEKKVHRKNNPTGKKNTTSRNVPIEIQNGKSGISSFGGLWSAVRLFQLSGLPGVIDSAIGARSNRGYRDSEHVLALALLQLAGGRVVDHLSDLEGKLRFEELGISIPSPSSSRKWLSEFHNEEEDKERGQGRSFIPGENSYLAGFRTVFSHLLSFSLTHGGARNGKAGCITLDQDATFIDTEEEGALWNYKGARSYQAFNTYCPEADLVVAGRYSDGNVNPGFRQKEEFERILSGLPGEVKGVSLRSDGAGYQSDLLLYCNEGKNKRFGRIPFGISCPVVKEFREAVRSVPSKDWKPLGEGRVTLKDGSVAPLAEWSEVAYAPGSLSRKKHGPDYRFFAIREIQGPNASWDVEQGRLFDGPDEGRRTNDSHTLALGDRTYKIRGIVSNIDDGDNGDIFGYSDGESMNGERIILWQRKRCGKSEEVHHILKGDLGGGHIPSKRFGANAAWWSISALALNLHNLLKRLLLPPAYRKSRPKTLRFLLYTMACKIVRHSRRTVLKVWSGDRGGRLFSHAVEKLDELRRLLE